MQRLILAFWLACIAVLIWSGSQDVGLQSQAWLGVVAVCGLLVLHLLRPTGALRIFFMLLAAYVSVRYLMWRTFSSLPPVDSAGFIPGLLLYVAEIQAALVYFLGLFTNIYPVEREPAPLPQSEAHFPFVDVFVTSYDEDPELLRVTLAAATQIRYPADRLRVYLLDDGGTAAKLTSDDPVVAGPAYERAGRLRELCAELDVTYLTRADNTHAKAGNLNAALAQTDGQLILVLDADHVPAQDILENTVGYFLQDADLGLVQTPHFFITPDPVERNLGTFQAMPSESEMFYGRVQRGLDFWNAAMFCGSAAVLRRDYLVGIGGFATNSVTEDAETSLELHAHGLKSLYLGRPMVAALAPPTFSAFIVQRTRWTQGMLQILMLKNPLLKRGLTLPQRLCYLNSCSFWLFPYSRLIFVIAPLFYLLFGLKVFATTLQEFVVFTVPHLICSLMLINHLFGRFRWPFVSDLYELVQSVYLWRACLGVLFRPRSPVFRVTPKTDTILTDRLSPMALPVLLLLGLLVAGAVVGVFRYFMLPLEREHLYIVMSWNAVNLVLALAAVGVMYERAHTRVRGWIPRSKPVNVIAPSWEARGTLEDATFETARVVLDPAQSSALGFGEKYAELQIVPPGRAEVRSFEVVIHREQFEAGRTVLDLRFLAQGADARELVRVCFGDSANWAKFLAMRQRRRSVIAGLLTLALLGAKRSWALVRASLGGDSLKPVPATALDMAPVKRPWTDAP